MSLAGTLDELALPDILQIVSLSEKTGRLTLTAPDGEGMIVFRKGRIIYAASNSAREAFGSMLVCKKLVDEETLRKALMRQHKSHEERRLGRILVEMGALSAADLDRVVQEQVERVIGFLFGWREGFFKFEPMDIPDRGEVEVDAREFLAEAGLNAHKVALDLTRLVDEQGRQAPPVPESVPMRHTVELVGGQPAPSATLQDIIAEHGGPALTAEVTMDLLRSASVVLARVVLLMVERHGVAGIGHIGLLDDEESADVRVRNLWLPIDEPSVIMEAVSSSSSYRGRLAHDLNNERFVAQLGGGWPDEVAVMPMSVRGRVVAVLYGDNLTTGTPIPALEPLESMLAQLGGEMAKSGRGAGSHVNPGVEVPLEPF
jgi:hypothetical protein